MNIRALIRGRTAGAAGCASIFCAVAALALALPAGALAKDGSATVRGKTLKVIAENTNLAEPGDLPEWRKAYIYIRVADSSYRGWDGSDIGVDVTGKYRVADVGGGSMVAGQGCIMGRTIFGNESHSVAFCEPSAVQRIVIKTANGNDGVKLESIDPNYSVPATVASTISTGKGHDGVLGGSGPDKINTGGDNDGGTEDPNTQAPESVSGNGGNDNINLSTSDAFNTDESDLFPYQAAHGGDGNDTVVTKGAFFDKIFGDDGEDRLVGGKGPDTIYGGAGDDYIRAANGDNQVYGQDGADSLGGGGGSDELYGGPGDDSFNSGSGDDMIDASDDQGKDSKIRCGGGSFDTLYFDSADGDPAAWKDCEDKTAQ